MLTRARVISACFAAATWIAMSVWAEEGVFHVSADGDDRWSGRLSAANEEGTDGPFATLERARDAIRTLKAGAGLPAGGVTVLISGGIYSRGASFELSAEDSGTAEAPIVYRAAEGERPRFSGGVMVGNFKPVADDAIRTRLDPVARESVRVADLRGAGITEYGSLVKQGFGRGGAAASLELYFGGKRMQLARWPNAEWTRISVVPNGTDGGMFAYSGDRPDRWAEDADVWVHGYWTWDWADSFERVVNIDREERHLFTEAPHGVYGYKEGARFYFLNILEELDQPGEWFLDRPQGLLYFWPPTPLDGSETQISMLEAPLVTMKKVSHVTLRGLAFECGRGGGISISGGTLNLIAGCTLSQFGTAAVSISGTGNGITSCDLRELGKNGITINGGDRMTLTPGGNFAVNNEIQRFGLTVRTYVPAASVSGVGNRIAHNLIHDAPHMAIGLSGNDHVIEYNEVHHVCMETHDCGVFYMGRDWSQRGNSVRYNHFHDSGSGDVQAIYLDDWTSGVEVYGNICRGVRRGILIGGGRDNHVVNNIFIDCGHAVHIDERGKGWASYYFDGTTTTLFDRMKAVDATGPIYTARYPELTTLLDDDPKSAKGNVVARNIRFGGGWLELYDGLSEQTPYLEFENNWTEGDPGFVDAAGGDYRLREDAKVLGLGFQPIPVERIGLYGDEYRDLNR
ncbi:MAG: right-handed parallel beta-helix repeat-containing protein [Planctomycetota bacterium]